MEFKEVFEKWQTELYNKGWNSPFLNNHDLPRAVSRFGDDGKYRVESARAGNLPSWNAGEPHTYIQGEELGMTNVQFDIQEYRDIELLNMYKERKELGYPEEEIMRSIYVKGRDNARTPMQWSEEPNAGFTEGIPWIRCNPNYTMINAEESMIDQDSVFYYYQKLIRLRKTEPILTEGKFQLLLKEDPSIFAYTRTTEKEQLLVLCNFKGKKFPMNFPAYGKIRRF